MYKRANYNNTQKSVDATTELLQCIGMRIRKSVSDGYSVPMSNGYSTDYEEQQQMNSPRRVPLPNHLSQPPMLSYGYSSTLEGESFSEKFLQSNSNKRIRDDDEGIDQYFRKETASVINVANKDAPMEYFHTKYGSLSFNEEF